MRSSEGKHDDYTNQLTKLKNNAIIDPGLTLEGIKQSNNIFDEIKKINFDCVYVSDLLRSRETISYALSKNLYKDNVYVLPCSHELSYNDINCENTSLFSLDFNNKMTTNIDKTLNIINNSLIWYYYIIFNSHLKKRDNVNNCMKTSMISQCLNIYNQEEEKKATAKANEYDQYYGR